MQNILRHYNLTNPLFISLYGCVVLVVVHIFEYGFGYLPCQLCMYQRLPWAIVIVLGLLAYFMPKYGKGLLYMSAIVLLFGTVLAVFHAGVEYGFWQGLESCGGEYILSSGADLLSALDTQTVPRCDKASWTLFGISMAGYNALISLDASVFSLILASVQGCKKS